MNLNLTARHLRSLLRYDEATGEFTWISGQRAGMRAGYSVSTGYTKVNIEKVTYLAHRLAWLYMHGEWPKQHIDHLNGKGRDNRIANLRDVSQGINLQNKRAAQSNSTTGILGVSMKRGKYKARVAVGGIAHHIGTFLTLEEAHAAYLSKKRELHIGCTI